MSNIFGIDLGTTNSVLSELVDGIAVPVPIDGDFIVPSTVLYLKDRAVVGREARNLELQHPERIVRSAKRKIGTDHRYNVAGKSLAPEEVSAEVLRAIIAGAAKVGRKVSDAVITVPAYFDDAQRRATLRAGELAGLNVLRLNEPTAASLVYDQVGEARDRDEPELILVYDLGGGTFDVSILEVFDDVREVKATTGNTRLGGDDFDDKLVQHFIDVLKTKSGADPRDDIAAMARLRRLAEDSKIKLSREPSVSIREEYLTQVKGRPVHLELELHRHEFQAMIGPLLESTITLTRECLVDAGIEVADIDRIVLVGGSTRIPLVRELIREHFGDPEAGADIHDEVDPDLAVAHGAAVQAGILAGAPVGRLLVDVAAHSLGVLALSDLDDRMDADTFIPIIPKNTVLPATRTSDFYTVVDRQDMIDVEVFQGEHSRASRNLQIGNFTHRLKPRPQQSLVHVTFSYDLDGIVKVLITQPGVEAGEAVDIVVADKAREAAPVSESAIERKANDLLAQLSGAPKARLAALLEDFRKATPKGKAAAEEALLDFFLDHGDD
jgi:molecular chaperone DnaK